MDKFPLLGSGHPAGELATEKEPLYTWFTARCHLPEEGLWCAWAVGEQGELRLGVLEPEGGQMSIRRRFSDRMTAPWAVCFGGRSVPPWRTPPSGRPRRSRSDSSVLPGCAGSFGG